MSSSEQFAVRLLNTVEPLLREKAAERIAPRLGLGSDRIIKLLERQPGLITKPTSQDGAQRIAYLFSSAGVGVKVVRLNDDTDPALLQSWTNMRLPQTIEQRLRETEVKRFKPGVTAQAAASIGGDTGPAQSKVVTKTAPTAKTVAEPPKQVTTETPPPKPPEEVDIEVPSVLETTAPLSLTRRRFSLRWQLLFAAISPLLLLVAATLYISYDNSGRLLSEVGQNLATTIATNLDIYLLENNAAVTDPETISYFRRSLEAFETAALPVLALQYTDADGLYVTGNWEQSMVQSADFVRFEAGFHAAARAAMNSGVANQGLADFIQLESNSLGRLYVIAKPLANNAGTVQVILAQKDVLANAINVMRPFVVISAAVLLLALLFILIPATALANKIRYLAVVADRISQQGDLDHPVILRGNDETRDVAEALERFRLSLKLAINRIRTQEKSKRND